MSEEIKSNVSDVDSIVAENIAKAETAPMMIDNKISGTSMGIMTFIVIIAICCIAGSIFYGMLNPDTGVAETTNLQGISNMQVTDFTELPEGIAAEVNGIEIPESRVNDYIEYYRNISGLEDDDQWAAFVSEGYGDTEGLRTFVLELFINQELVRQAAASSNIFVTDEELQEIIDNEMDEYDIPDEDAFWALIENSGLTEDEYKSIIENELLQDKIVEYVNPESAYADRLDDEILAYIKRSYPARANIESLDEVSDEVIESSKSYVIYNLNTEAYNKFMDDYIQSSDVKVASTPDSVGYGADTGMLQLKQMWELLKLQAALSQIDGDAQPMDAE